MTQRTSSSFLARTLGTTFVIQIFMAAAGCSTTKHSSPQEITVPPVEPRADVSTPLSLSLFAAGATKATVVALVPDFAARSGFAVNLNFGSVGSLRDQILAGTSGADVALLTPAIITALDAKRLVRADSRVDLAQIGGGIAVRSGDALPDTSDSDKLKALLLAADEIYYADPTLATAGAAFMRVCTTLGVADTCAAAPNGKGHTAASGADAMAAMALSTATTVVGATQVSEIKATSGVQLVGEYPESPINLQVKTVYSAIIVEGTQDLADAQRLVQFVSGDAFKAQLASYGFDPIPAP